MKCDQCGADQGSGRYCAACGVLRKPAARETLANPGESAIRRGGALVAVVVVLVIGGVGAWALLRPNRSTPTASQFGVYPGESSPSASLDFSVGPGATMSSTLAAPPAAPTPTTPPPDPNVVAAGGLEGQRGADVAGVSLDGRWALQVASKYDGVVDTLQTTESGSHQFQLVDILREHQQLRARLTSQGVRVFLLKATDFGKSTTANPERIWVTIADPGGIDSAASANNRCRELFPELDASHLANACVGRTLSAPHS